MAVLDLIAAERRRVADLLETLDDDQWDVQSLCAAWTVREVAAHLTAGWNVQRLAFGRLMLEHRGFDGANAALATQLAQRPVEAIIDDLRRHADDPFKAPVVGHVGQLADVICHGQDIARPLGITHTVEAERVTPALDLAVSRRVSVIQPTAHLKGLRFEASDQPWSWGQGPVVSGDSTSLLLVLMGRTCDDDRLAGPGASEVRRRLSAL